MVLWLKIISLFLFIWQVFGIALHFDIVLIRSPAWSVVEGVSDIFRFGHDPRPNGDCLLQWHIGAGRPGREVGFFESQTVDLMFFSKMLGFAASLHCCHADTALDRSGHWYNRLWQLEMLTIAGKAAESWGCSGAGTEGWCFFVLLGLVPKCGF